jgi:thioredoxin reductase (NADPH)
MLDRAKKNPKIKFLTNKVIKEVLGVEEGGKKRMTGVILEDTRDHSTTKLDADGLFIAIGHKPNTELFKNYLEMDETGYLIVKPGSTYTNIEGVFAAGDVADKKYRQAITAAGTGCMAALDAERWLEAQES